MQAVSEHRIAYRPDLDGLRAVAVLAVAVYHYFPRLLPGGFAGVDVFFVLSGFLIGGIIQDGLAAGDFSLGNFYRHRIRRILPALLLVLVAMLAAGWLLFLPDEYLRVSHGVTAGALFSANLFYWNLQHITGGYFDPHVRFDALLHLWSLGVEEQFYIGWPLLMILIHRWRYAIHAAIALFVLSLACSIMLTYSHPVAGFYLPISRIWEILAGVLLAWTQRRGLALPAALCDGAAALGGALVAGAFVLLQGNTPYPGIFALAPVLGTVLLIQSGPQALPNRLLAMPAPVYVGRISYPLYLWHWPLLAGARTVFADMLTRPLRLLLLGLSFALAIATYELLEKRMRARAASGRLAILLLGVALLVGAAGMVAQPLRAAIDPAHFAVDHLGWPPLENSTCARRYQTGQTNWGYCLANSAAPQIVLLGNSHANHLYPGLVAQPALARRGIVNLAGCWPIDKAEWLDHVKGHPCAPDSLAAQADFVASLSARIPSVRHAIIAAAWLPFSPAGAELDFATATPVADQFHSVAPGDAQQSEEKQYLASLERSIAALEQQQIQVTLILDVPSLSYDPRLCLARPLLGRTRDCSVPLWLPLRVRQQFMVGLADIRKRHAIAVFDPLPLFCHDGMCRMSTGEDLYLRDNNHLSVSGSNVMGRALAGWMAHGVLAGDPPP